MIYAFSTDLVNFVLSPLPNTWDDNGIIIYNFPSLTVEELNTFDWYTYESPTVGENEKTGDFLYNPTTKIVTKDVIPLTQEEIDSRVESESQNRAIEQANQINLGRAQEEAQNFSDSDAVGVVDIYPFWNGNGIAYATDFKVKFINTGVLELYKVVQGHTSQPNFDPPSVPALFTQIPLDGQVLAWVQPTGAQDAYQINSKVGYNGTIWTSNIANNVWEPGLITGQWTDTGEPFIIT